MKLVQVQHGVLEIRWPWLPFWLAVNPRMKTELEQQLQTGVLLGGITDSLEDEQLLHDWLCRRLAEMFPDHRGLGLYLDAVKYIEEPPRPHQ
jgi:hypothetical protein